MYINFEERWKANALCALLFFQIKLKGIKNCDERELDWINLTIRGHERKNCYEFTKKGTATFLTAIGHKPEEFLEKNATNSEQITLGQYLQYLIKIAGTFWLIRFMCWNSIIFLYLFRGEKEKTGRTCSCSCSWKEE